MNTPASMKAKLDKLSYFCQELLRIYAVEQKRRAKAFIIFTLLKMATGGILIPYTLMQHNKVAMIPISQKLNLYTHFHPTCLTIWHK
jgi:hypothetical protein